MLSSTDCFVLDLSGKVKCLFMNGRVRNDHYVYNCMAKRGSKTASGLLIAGIQTECAQAVYYWFELFAKWTQMALSATNVKLDSNMSGYLSKVEGMWGLFSLGEFYFSANPLFLGVGGADKDYILDFFTL